MITYTDKDSRVVVCIPNYYIIVAEVHLSKDEKVEWEEVKPTVERMNRITKNTIKIFNIGQDGSRGQKDRVWKAGIRQDTSPPNVSFLWKTKKDYIDLPPTRPVCDSSQGPLARTSDLLAKILVPIMNKREYTENCDSTEDLLEAITTANKKISDAKPDQSDIGLMSMDAKALYPSLNLNDILDGVWTLILESGLRN